MPNNFTAGVVEPATDLREKLNRPLIPSLDGIRAVAASIVVMYHFGWPPFVPAGGFGVLMFFVLSGFLITGLLLKENERSGQVSLKRFYQRRALRIFPAFYCYVVVIVVTLLLLRDHVPWAECRAALLYVSNYYYAFTHSTGNVMGMSWSLGVEEQFYLVWPLAFSIFRRRQAGLAKGLVGLIVGVTIYRWVLFFGLGAYQKYIEYAFECRLDHLMLGALLAISLRSGWLTRILPKVCTRSAMVVNLVLLYTSASLANKFGPSYMFSVGFSLNPVLIGILLCQVIHLTEFGPVRVLNHPWVRYLGRISYPLYLYLYHTLAMMVAERVFVGYRFSVIYCATLLTAVLLASASFYIVERPFLSLKDRIGRRKAAAAAA